LSQDKEKVILNVYYIYLISKHINAARFEIKSCKYKAEIKFL